MNSQFQNGRVITTNQNLKDLNINHIQYDATASDFNDELVPEELHGFVYLPGSINLRPFRSIKSTTFEEDLNINFLSMVKILQKVINNLKKSGNSSIVLQDPWLLNMHLILE